MIWENKKQKDYLPDFAQKGVDNMPEQRIVVTIDDNGKINAETHGIKGEVCINELQELLGEISDLESITKTDEYYQHNELHVQKTQKLGRQ